MLCIMYAMYAMMYAMCAMYIYIYIYIHVIDISASSVQIASDSYILQLGPLSRSEH